MIPRRVGICIACFCVLASARSIAGDRDAQVHEVGDVLAWLASLAAQLGIDLDEAAGRYAHGCPRCGRSPCTCA